MTKRRNLLPPRRPWAADDINLVRRLYADTLTADLAAMLGRPVQHVYSKARKLGLSKGAAWLATGKSGRLLKGGKLGQEHQFAAGHTPWNAGTHYVAGGRSAETQFKPGGRPHTWVPVGTYRVNSEGYLERKYSDDPGGPHKRWRGVHRLVWEAQHGPTPSGHVVVFKPGRRSTELADITLDTVELITRRQLMERNTVHQLPPELVALVQLRGAVNRQINARSKKA